MKLMKIALKHIKFRKLLTPGQEVKEQLFCEYMYMTTIPRGLTVIFNEFYTIFWSGVSGTCIK